MILLLGLIVLFSLVAPSFLAGRNWNDMLVVQVVIGCMTLAAIMPLVAGEFDLSLGYMLGFVSMWGAFLAQQNQGPWVVIPGMLGAGVVIGLLNAVLTVYFKISSFIATLGVGIILNGMTDGLSDGQVLFSHIPHVLTVIGQGSLLGLGISVWLTLLLAAVMFYVLEHTPLGRFLYAIGGSERVAYLAGVRTGLIKVVAFIVAGFLVGIGALFQLGQAGAATPGFGPDLLLPAYAAAFLGVTTFRPGYYNVVGALIAILLLAVGFDGLSLLGVPFWVQPIFNGAVLLIAVLTARAEARHVRMS